MTEKMPFIVDKNMRPAEHKAIKLLYGLGTLFFMAWGAISLSTGDIELVYDRFFTGIFFFLGLALYRRLHLGIQVVLFSIAAFTLHHLKLYGQTYFGWLEFDMLMHVVAGAAITMVAYSWLSKEESWSTLKVALIAALIAAGIASLNEMIEYFGYAFLGSGEGILFYGVGDFGEYADTALDLLSNVVGAVIGAGVIAALTKRRCIKEERGAEQGDHEKRRRVMRE